MAYMYVTSLSPTTIIADDVSVANEEKVLIVNLLLLNAKISAHMLLLVTASIATV